MKRNVFADGASIAELGNFLSGGTKKSLDDLKSEARVVGTSRLKLDPIPTTSCPKKPKKSKKSRKLK